MPQSTMLHLSKLEQQSWFERREASSSVGLPPARDERASTQGKVMLEAQSVHPSLGLG